ncbi:hypothetical protein C0992_003894 [Termitomyces sp. T32_za158]|nr:hypothetical protein C0992_003894 [Termitomyces sp. T32_za158]
MLAVLSDDRREMTEPDVDPFSCRSEPKHRPIGQEPSKSVLINQWMHLSELKVDVYTNFSFQILHGSITPYNKSRKAVKKAEKASRARGKKDSIIAPQPYLEQAAKDKARAEEEKAAYNGKKSTGSGDDDEDQQDDTED